MSKKKSEFLGSLGIMWQIWKALTDEILSLGGNDETIRLIETDSDLRRQMAELVLSKAQVVGGVVSKYLESAHYVVVDYSQSLAQMIDAGKYNWVNDFITAEHFPIKGFGNVPTCVELLHFNEYFNNGDEIIVKLKEINEWLVAQDANYRYRFARIEELLAIGITKSKLQWRFPIAALEGISLDIGHGRRFVFLSSSNDNRILDLKYFEQDLGGYWRFAVVREPVDVVSKYLESSHDVVVDYSQSLAQMIDAGKYDSDDENITAEQFPIKGSGKVSTRVELLHFDECFSNGTKVIVKLDKVNEWLVSQGANYRYRFARIEELLALGASQYDLQRKFLIAALESTWYNRIVCIRSLDDNRRLGLYSLEDNFDVYWHFAVIREPIETAVKVPCE